MRPRLAAALLLLAACKFPYPADVPDDDATTDGGDDGSITCEPSTISCDDARGEYVACSAAGIVDLALHCPLGCAPDEEKCLDIDPHNGLAMYLDMVPAPQDLVLTGPATIDTVTGAILDSGVGVSVPTFLKDLGDGSTIRVFVVRDLSISTSLDVAARPGYNPPLAIVASGQVSIRGPINVSADSKLPGPGGRPPSDFQDEAICQGIPVLGSPPAGSPGGGGAGGFTAGGKGALTGQGEDTPGGGVLTLIEPLRGGCGGGIVYGSPVGSGGAGGGAIQIASRVAIRIEGLGSIDASGGGALAGSGNIGGGGGGAGGIILLEAPQVLLDGAAVVLSTKGGGGAGASAASMAGNGADGGLDAAPALGGTAPRLAIGGRGGMATGPGNGGVSADLTGSGGGGGGAAGLTAAFTNVGAIAPQNGAAVRGPLMAARLPTRRIP